MKFSLRLGSALLALSLLGACSPSNPGQDAAPEAASDAAPQGDSAPQGDAAPQDDAAPQADVATDVAVSADVAEVDVSVADASSGD